MKKILITIVALVVIVSAVYSVFKWQRIPENQPTRQGQEIR